MWRVHACAGVCVSHVAPRTVPSGPSPGAATRCSVSSQRAPGDCCCLRTCTGASASESRTPGLQTQHILSIHPRLPPFPFPKRISCFSPPRSPVCLFVCLKLLPLTAMKAGWATRFVAQVSVDLLRPSNAFFFCFFLKHLPQFLVCFKVAHCAKTKLFFPMLTYDVNSQWIHNSMKAL